MGRGGGFFSHRGLSLDHPAPSVQCPLSQFLVSNSYFTSVQQKAETANLEYLQHRHVQTSHHLLWHLIPQIRQVGQSTSGTKSRPCLNRMSIISSLINLSLKLSTLFCSSTALSFSAATKMYWPNANESVKIYLTRVLHTCPMLEPVLNETR